MHTSLNERARFNMIEQQIRPARSCSDRVLALLQEIPREDFVPAAYQALAWADTQIPLAQGVIPTPIMVSAMLDALQPGAADTVLEIGTGTGFLTACLARMGGHVTSLGSSTENLAQAKEQLSAHGITNVSLIEGSLDALPSGSFDAILLGGSALPQRHPGLEAKLTQGGRLFAVIGEQEPMQACLIRRTSATDWDCRVLFETSLPLLNHTSIHTHFQF